MQFVYLDESGTGDEAVAVMAGVIADSNRMRRTKEDWNNLLNDLSEIIGRSIDEIHTREFYSGNSPWGDLKGNQRAEIIETIFNWLYDRKHSIVFTAVDKEKFYNNRDNDPYLNEIGSLWRFMAMHIALAIQKHNQGSPRNRNRTINPKGSSVLIFDHEHREQQRFTNLILYPPDWTDTYYDKRANQEKMNQIVDVPHFVDSKQVGLIQLADFICFFLRRHLELELDIDSPNYHDEKEKVAKWANLIFERSIGQNKIFKKQGRCYCAELFYQYAPEPVK